jgi:hypothetical protein
MTLLNVGNWDRVARILVGILLLAAGSLLASGALGLALATIGAVMLATGLIRWCPAYTVFGISTVKTPARE